MTPSERSLSPLLPVGSLYGQKAHVLGAVCQGGVQALVLDGSGHVGPHVLSKPASDGHVEATPLWRKREQPGYGATASIDILH